MPLQVYNFTKNKWIRYPSECDASDELWYSKCDSSTPIFIRGYTKKDGAIVCSHWSHSPNSLKIINSSGKYGIMTSLHREGELEIYCKWRGKDINLIPPVELTCPACNFCSKFSREMCSIHTKNRLVNLRDLYPETKFDPVKNFFGEFSFDTNLYNDEKKQQAGLEIHNSNEVSLRKSLEGWPIIEFKCDSQKRLDWLKTIVIIDLSGLDIEANDNICHYNLALLPCFANNLQCSFETILGLLHDEKEKIKKPHRIKKDKENYSERINPGLQPWDPWPIGPPSRKGEILEEIYRNQEGGKQFLCDWIRKKKGMPLLSRRTRERYQIEANEDEKELDLKIYNDESI